MSGLLQQGNNLTDIGRRTVMHKMMMLGSMVLSLSILAPYAFADEETTQGTGTHMKVSGVVSKVQ